MNLPNTITLARLLLTAACFVLLELAGPGTEPSSAPVWAAFWIFVVAAVSDFFDGWLARRNGQVTAFGRVADPFVDKILICGVLTCLLRFPIATEHMSTWMVVVILGREFLVTAVRGLAESEGVEFGADGLGKVKMVVQCCTAGALLTLVAGSTFWTPVAAYGIWATLVLTVWSGVHYVWKARGLLRAS
ncbi:MAG: CDP-diacylglycerol--glycerol-3-phosphate 3-phosphatidyltransferase [Planctomycetota bacterium]|nr:CDP-diacylglycerol--glycerol-3-phosphate 3-phosphatidyltransferase [Planctomycetota bacterium]MDA0932160.1 CDP-diacylglycerol--glycerol-3-phosphate 3-phosphatidyltransferase [Planctomycetota bacterium]MDA1220652.1 CDP-diacylglycerol--glycerol-3-phosphate 3-phosphatidyltransferase [Planctomycetota bacterium]